MHGHDHLIMSNDVQLARTSFWKMEAYFGVFHIMSPSKPKKNGQVSEEESGSKTLRPKQSSLFWSFEGAASGYSVTFAFIARPKNCDCSRKCPDHQTMTARSVAQTAQSPKLSRANVVFAVLPCGCHFFRKQYG